MKVYCYLRSKHEQELQSVHTVDLDRPDSIYTAKGCSWRVREKNILLTIEDVLFKDRKGVRKMI